MNDSGANVMANALFRGVFWWEGSLSCYPNLLVLVGMPTSSKLHLFDDLTMLKHVEATQKPNGTL